ncbi:MAG: sensor histidine kinase [Romboutsia sp.]|nr:sensor histidine kinase [Romboutsia sp.]
MSLLKKSFRILEFMLILTIFAFIHINFSNNTLYSIILYGLCLFLLTNEYVRITKLGYESSYAKISLLLTIISINILHYAAGQINTIILMYLLLYDIFKLEKKYIDKFIIFHSIIYFTILVFSLLHLPISLTLVIITINIIAYAGICGMLYNQKNLKLEKEEIAGLNDKLKMANIKLHEYASTIEEVAILHERTRVSQELHDSLGHSLMALSMYLEYAKKTYASNPEKLDAVLSKAEEIAKSSISDLRKTVSLLNSDLEITCFDDAIEKLIDNFNLFNNIKFTYEKNKSIEDLSPSIKTALYKSIKEAITNSLKHGNATEINIKLQRNTSILNLIVTNNGDKCTNIIKSNGLNGIESRIKSLNGFVEYILKDDFGFGIKISIPT